MDILNKFDFLKYIDKFFGSLNNYLNYNSIFLIFLSLFVIVVVLVYISTSHSYEAKLIKAIDMFNNYFVKEPQITAANLIAFNNKMKSNKVPKQLRRQWQQFVLYRDKSASEYMSFEICVSSPLKNSRFKRDVRVMNIICYIFAIASFLLNLYYVTYESASISAYVFTYVLQRTLLCPLILVVINFLVTIFFEYRHNAIVNDLNQNFQYFEVNIDKATTTIPEYVDYELLFDKSEIKRGIPILYTYLQRRQEEEKRELERARLKNVEHEKFNFDEAGVAKSLVLERAMQEAENYIAERKKFVQDTEQINSEITQEELNFREITKEYQREMQVSKETFENFKAQLTDASSSIESNYLKKQQQQELDRQRNLERDYDLATDRHNQLLKTLQGELDEVNNQISVARKNLEKGMMSEFDTYSQKVYADAESVIKERHNIETDKLSKEVAELKAQLEELSQENKELRRGVKPDKKKKDKNSNDGTDDGDKEYTQENPYEENLYEKQEETTYNNNEKEYSTNELYNSSEQAKVEQQNYPINKKPETLTDNLIPAENLINPTNSYSYLTSTDPYDYQKIAKDESLINNYMVDEAANSASNSATNGENEGENSQPNTNAEQTVSNTTSTTQNQESEPKKKRGRPRKPKVDKPKRGVGRPRKVVDENAEPKPKRGRGRPRKIIIIQDDGDSSLSEIENIADQVSKSETDKGGSNAKAVSVVTLNGDENIGDIDSYLQEIDNQIAEENAKMEESKKELEKNTKIRKHVKKK